MLSEQETAYIAYWEKIRNNKQKQAKQFVTGFSIGLAIGCGIITILVTGWYERANMVAGSQFSPVIFAIIIAAIAFFVAYFYRNYKWERNEQLYQELLAKKKRLEKTGDVQQLQ